MDLGIEPDDIKEMLALCHPTISRLMLLQFAI